MTKLISPRLLSFLGYINLIFTTYNFVLISSMYNLQIERIVNLVPKFLYFTINDICNIYTVFYILFWIILLLLFCETIILRIKKVEFNIKFFYPSFLNFGVFIELAFVIIWSFIIIF